MYVYIVIFPDATFFTQVLIHSVASTACHISHQVKGKKKTNQDPVRFQKPRVWRMNDASPMLYMSPGTISPSNGWSVQVNPAEQLQPEE